MNRLTDADTLELYYLAQKGRVPGRLVRPQTPAEVEELTGLLVDELAVSGLSESGEPNEHGKKIDEIIGHLNAVE